MSRSDRRQRKRRANPIGSNRLSQSAGFTLIEVLVALTIALLALDMLYRITSTSLEGGETAERYSRALLIAETALQSVGLGEAPQSGSFERRVAGIYDRDIVVRPRADLLGAGNPPPQIYPYEITARVFWHDGARTRSIALSTIRLGPPPR